MAITAETNRVSGHHGQWLIDDVALRKARFFLRARAVILVVAPETSQPPAIFFETQVLQLALRKFAASDAAGNRVAVGTISDALVATAGRHSPAFCAKQST